MLIGEFSNNLDLKKRLVIPIKFRDLLGNSCIVTRGFENCIFVYNLNQWQEMQNKIEKLSLTKKSNRLLARFFLSAATQIDFDNQGRINLPKALCEHANLEKECVIMGMGNRLEIWNKNNWAEYLAQNTDDLDEIVDEIEGIEL